MQLKIVSKQNLLIRIAICVLLTGSILFVSECSQNENHPTDILLANIDSSPVYEKEVNARLNIKIEEMKRELLFSMIEEKILAKEAKIRGMTVDSLLYLEATKKASNVTSADFNRYVEQYNISTKKKSAVDIIRIMKQIKQDEKRLEYITQLKQKYNVSVSLFPSSFKIVKPDKLFYYQTHPSKQNNICVYIITDPVNSVCTYISPRLKTIVKKYEEQINFRYIINNRTHAMHAIYAANKQKKLIEMHNLICENQPRNEKDFIGYAQQLNLDLKKFKKDIKDSQIAEQQKENMKKLTSLGVITLPAFIINNKLVDQNNSIDYLDALIQSEIQNRK